MKTAKYMLLCLFACIGSAYAAPDFSHMDKLLQGEKPQNVAETAIPGLYEFNLGSEVLYISEDGRYLIEGEMIDLGTRENMTEVKRAASRAKALAGMDKKDMIVFSPKEKPKHVAYVFTDIDCGYCRMLHKNIDGYNNKGIEIRYLAFPRAGVGSEAYKKAVNVWCADDRKQAMTEAKLGKTINSKACDAPVRRQYQAGLSMGVRGTPALILEDGTLVPGFVRPDKLLVMLDEHSKAQSSK